MPRALPFILLPLALTALVAPGCGSSKKRSTPTTNTGAAPATAATGPVSVALSEYAIKPAAVLVKAGKVTFDVSNDGAIPHEFVVLKTDKRAADLLNGAKADETGKVGKLSEKQLGVRAKQTLRLDLTPGHYVLICNLPGHYQGGMHTDFTVE